ncbi:GGDEF domain-containing protein [Vogesella oryzae]|uniref:GGDEF domain-containing protein n=1 Tax=Vogesella oryzae TaxID=1735285 RepID=UPI001581A823|nr:GGDEF domain-containing protein [Vogesella oryzae]
MAPDNQLDPASFMPLLLDAVCAVDAAGNFVFVSAASEQIFGYTPAEMVGRSMLAFIHPDDLERTLSAAGKIMRGQPNPHFENRYIRKDGSIAHIMWSARWSESKQMRIAVARDVTERKRAESMQAALYAISEAAHAAENLQALFRQIHHIIAGLLPAQDFAVALCDAGAQQLSISYQADLSAGAPDSTGAATLCALGNQVVSSGQPLLWQCDSQQPPSPDPQLQSWLGVPLSASSGVIGVLILKSRDPGMRYTVQHQELLQYVSTQIATAIERKQLHSRLQHLAQHDPLTGLPNRALLNDRLQSALARAMRNASRIALLYLDLDNFKHINDSLGHTTGDRLLQEVASRLSSCVRETDSVARIGGDEFIVLLEDLQLAEHAGTVAEKIQQAFAAPLAIGADTIPVNVSIGVALYPENGNSGQQLLGHADDMMYRMKKQRRDKTTS